MLIKKKNVQIAAGCQVNLKLETDLVKSSHNGEVQDGNCARTWLNLSASKNTRTKKCRNAPSSPLYCQSTNQSTFILTAQNPS